MKLNAEQIKKVLEHCANWTFETGCEGCPYDGNCIDEDLIKDALALINSLEQRIEAITVELDAMRGAANSYKMHNEKLTEENERLRAERDILDVLVKDLRGRNNGLQRANESLAKDCDILEDELNECVQIKADTVRKMHSEIKERCLKGGIYPAFVASTIDQIVKEMLEDKK